MKLIDDWRRAWRFASVWAATALAVLSVLQAEVLPLFQFAIPADRWPWVTAVFGAAIVGLRLVSQAIPEPPTPPDPPLETITVTVPRGMDPAEFSATVARHRELLVAQMTKQRGAA